MHAAARARHTSAMRLTLPLSLLLILTGCGDLPQPFRGRPGPEAERLRRPPPARLDVVPPTQALLPDAASGALSQAVADQLLALELPAAARAASKQDWSLATTAAQAGGAVVPKFEVFDPHGASQGTVDGAPVKLADWAGATPPVLLAVATDAAPKISALLARIQAAKLQADPNSLYNRPAKVVVAEVTGATGDGNQSLTRRMREDLAKQGPVIQDDRKTADFTVQGQVVVVPIPGNLVRVEIQWIVRDAQDAERGRIVQLNEVPPDSVRGLWGDVAEAVASEAAGGVRDVLLTSSGRR